MTCTQKKASNPKRSWGAPMDDQLPVRVSTTKIKKETPSVKTFFFDHEFSFEPGQFVMVWIPGVDEIPMALSSANSITVQKVGDATGAMFDLEPSAPLGIRGPFGNGFTRGEKMLAIAGGAGAAPILPLARSDCVMTMLLGARTEKELLFVDQLDESTDVMNDISLAAYDRIAVCGPEPMMSAVLSKFDSLGLASKTEFSRHRYMKCGAG